MSTSTVQMVFGSALNMVSLVLVIVVAYFIGSVFPSFFKSLQTFVFRFRGLGLG